MLSCSLPFYLPLSTEAPLHTALLVSWQHTALAVWREVNRLSTKRGIILQSSENVLTSAFFNVIPAGDTDMLRTYHQCRLWHFKIMVQFNYHYKTQDCITNV